MARFANIVHFAAVTQNLKMLALRLIQRPNRTRMRKLRFVSDGKDPRTRARVARLTE
jgi:hypothetical protein